MTIISLGASLLIEILLDNKNVNENMNNCKYAYQSYQHLMIQIKTALRLGQYNIQSLVNSIANLDNFFVVCPLVDKYKKDYYKNTRNFRLLFTWLLLYILLRIDFTAWASILPFVYLVV